MNQSVRGFVGLMVGLSALSAQVAMAEDVQTRVFKIAPSAPQGVRGAFEYQVFATNGRVYFASKPELVQKLRSFAEAKQPLHLDINGDDAVGAAALSSDEAAQFSDGFERSDVAEQANASFADEAVAMESHDDAGAGLNSVMPSSFQAAQALGYTPSILKSVSEAEDLFSSERVLNHHSECYQRAQVWTREMEQYRGVKSMKVFMFFTDRFRWRFTHKFLWSTRPYKWWFHVSPFVYVGGEEYALDREFLPNAVPMSTWTFEFIGKVSHDNNVSNPTPSEAECEDASQYSRFSSGASSRYCVLRKVPMYYFQPKDVEALDCRGGGSATSCARTVVSDWRQWEVSLSYKNTNR